MKEIVVYTDYVCPFCLLAESLLREAIEGKDIKITWRPHELRPFPEPTLKVEDGYLPSIWKRAVYPMAKKLEVDIKLPSISPQPRTDKAFEAFAFAEQQGLGDAFSMAALSAFFQKDLNIGNIDVLVKIGEEIGVDGKKLRESLEKNEFTQAHKDAIRKAKQEDQIKVVPTVIIGTDRYEGVPSKQWIDLALEKIDPRTIVER